MAVVEPIVGHLLSQYTETVNEGLEKMRDHAQRDPEFAVVFLRHPQGVQAVKSCLRKSVLTANVLDTLCVLVACSESPLPSTSTVTRGQQRGARIHLIRELCSGECFAVLRKALSVLSDATLPTAVATLKFLSVAATYAPKLLLARFNNKIPLHLACFRAQLPYSQRRIRLPRLSFLLRLAETKQHTTAADVVCTHGFLTSLFEDAAEVLQDGSQAGLEAGKATLRVFRDHFITSLAIPPEQKRSVLMSQRNIFRLLVKALEVPAVADDVAEVMYHMVVELVESPADYASSRVEAADGRGMPNFILFFLLRQLRPNVSARASRIVLFILTTVPDLIRPYFVRISGHLADEGNLLQRVAPSTARIATLNLMTRACLAPLPYHLLSRRATLEPVAAKSNTFYTMTPRDVADEICPQWLSEYVHKIINGSTNLMMLALAVQLAEAALTRAKAVLALVAAIQRDQQAAKRHEYVPGFVQPSGSHAATDETPGYLDADDVALFTVEDAQEEAEDFEARVHAQLLSALPSREEFWHRMTQQLHPTLIELYKKGRSDADGNGQRTASSGTSGGDQSGAEAAKSQAKVEFVYQRMLLLMQSYTDVFNLRVSWLSAAPSFLPSFQHHHPQNSTGTAGDSVIALALRAGNDALCRLSPQSISALCGLLVATLSRGVPMPKLHHITMSSPKGCITEWPLLLSLLLWTCKHREEADSLAVREAVAWVARVVQWVVHSVTVRQGCDYSEAVLWVMVLEEDAIPCFLHMINTLLQRSLSKAADRVTQELTGAVTADGDGGVPSATTGKGLLYAAAESFVSRTEEKMNGSKAVAEDAATTKKPKGKVSGAVRELWVEHLHACLPVFKRVLREVAAVWPRRSEAVVAPVVDPLRTAPSGGTKAVLTTAPAASTTTGAEGLPMNPQQAAVRQRLAAKPPANELLLTFCSSLKDPILVLLRSEGDTGDVGAHSVEETELLRLLAETSFTTTAKTAARQQDGSRFLKELTAATALPPSLWCRMKTLCWALAGHLLADLNQVTANTTLAPERLADLGNLHGVAQAVLRVVALEEGKLTTVLAEADETETLAFFVLLLVLVRVELLSALATPDAGSAQGEGPTAPSVLEESLIQALERLLLAVYGGCLSTADRVRYACLLSLHYLQRKRSGRTPTAATNGNEEEEEEEDGGRADSSDSSDESGVEDEDEDDDATASPPTSRGQHRNPYAHALVPIAFRTNRYLIAQHEPTALVTPEADMLAYIVGSMTEKEIQSLALNCPARLHNSLRCSLNAVAAPPRGPGARSAPLHGHGLDLLLSVFPEASCAEEVSVLRWSEASAATLTDPRYMLPLLNAVAALPGPRHRSLSLRCTPLLVRALSFTEKTMRRFAMATLVAVAQVPQPQLHRDATPEAAASHAGLSTRRIIASFARLKMVQLAAKQRRFQRSHAAGPGRRVSRRNAHGIPRLPGPLSAFLVLALDAVAAYDDRLHHHFVSFLNEPRAAFASVVPFAVWLSSFPIDAVSAPLMIKQQEEVQRSSSLVTSSIAQSSAEEALADLRRNAPPQLRFMLELVQHACGTTGDAVALVRSECVDRLMLLCDLVTSSPELRQQFIRCLTSVCTASFTVASLLALRGGSRDGSAGVLPWLLTFLQELHREYGEEVALYSEGLYTDSLKLLRVLCRVTATTAGTGRAALRSHTQMATQLEMLREHLLAVGVTAKETLDVMENCLAEWARLERTTDAPDDSSLADGAAVTQAALASSPPHHPVPSAAAVDVKAATAARQGKLTSPALGAKRPRHDADGASEQPPKAQKRAAKAGRRATATK